MEVKEPRVAPKIKAPDIKLPDIKLPKVELPKAEPPKAEPPKKKSAAKAPKTRRRQVHVAPQVSEGRSRMANILLWTLVTLAFGAAILAAMALVYS